MSPITYKLSLAYCAIGSHSDAVRRLRMENVDSVEFVLNGNTIKLLKWRGRIVVKSDREQKSFKSYRSDSKPAESAIIKYISQL